MEKYYVVKYTGPFAFIKPWTAVRDSETFSQQFLTPSIVEGIEKKLFPELLEEVGIKKILRHRLSYCGIDVQQERTWSKGGFKVSKDKKQYKTNLDIIKRGIILYPHLYLAFNSKDDADRAMCQTICLCRNEDLLHPEETIKIDTKDFDNIDGFELIFKEENKGFLVGNNRFDDASKMYGELMVHGNPIREK